MAKRRSGLRLLTRLALILALIPAVLLPATGIVAQSGIREELAYSPETGFFFFWDPAVVTLDDASSEPGMDFWSFSNNDLIEDVWAFNAPGNTVEDCVYGMLDLLADDPTTVSIEALPSSGGGPVEPLVFPDEAWASFILTASDSAGKETFEGSVGCGQIVPSESLYLWFRLRTVGVDDPGGPGYGLVLTPFSVLRDPGDSEGFADLRDDAGETRGTFVIFLPCVPEFTILAEGTNSAGDFVVDPSAIVAIDEEGTSLPVEVAAWTLPDADRQPRLSLAPGQQGLLRGHVETNPGQSRNVALYYVTPSGETRLHDQSKCAGGGAGAAPVPIDIE